MKIAHIPISGLLSVIFLLTMISCKSKEEREAELMHWEVVSNDAPDNIKVECSLFASDPGFSDFSFSKIHIEANHNEGEVVLCCTNHTFKTFDISKAQDGNIEFFFLDDHTVRIKFNLEESGKEAFYYGADIWSDDGIEYTKLNIKRTFGELEPNKD